MTRTDGARYSQLLSLTSNVGPPEPGARGTGRPLAPPIFGFDESKTFCPIVFYNCKAQLLLAPPNILTFPRVCSAVAYCHTIKFVNIPFLDKVVFKDYYTSGNNYPFQTYCHSF